MRNDDLSTTPTIKIPERMRLQMVERSQDAKKCDQPKTIFVPGLRQFTRAMSNHLARSSLFAPVNSGGGRNGNGSGGENRKKYFSGKLLVSRSDAEIRYWGEQLTEAHADVWMQVMYEAVKHPLGSTFEIKGANLLTELGKSCGGNDYKWLKNTLMCLHNSSLLLEVWQGSKFSNNRTLKLRIGGDGEIGDGDLSAIRLIEKFAFSSSTKSFFLCIDARWHLMYKNKEFALIDWEKRIQLKSNQAKALQRLMATSNAEEQRYALETDESTSGIKEIFQYTGRLNDFIDALGIAIEDLKTAKIISDGYFEISTKKKRQIVLKKMVGSRGRS